MRIDLNTQEADLLATVLDAALRDRLRQIHHAHTRDYRRRLEFEAEVMEALKARLTATHAAT